MISTDSEPGGFPHQLNFFWWGRTWILGVQLNVLGGPWKARQLIGEFLRPVLSILGRVKADEPIRDVDQLAHLSRREGRPKQSPRARSNRPGIDGTLDHYH